MDIRGSMSSAVLGTCSRSQVPQSAAIENGYSIWLEIEVVQRR